jgi:hypothetical protein
VKLARMRGADLVTESPRENQDDRQGDHVHEPRNHEHEAQVDKAMGTTPAVLARLEGGRVTPSNRIPERA